MDFLVRAKTIKQNFKKTSDGLVKIDGVWYAIGDYIENNMDCPCVISKKAEQYEVHKDTRAIHFENMVDSDKKPIFASLSEDGRGGDKLIRHFKNEQKPYDLIVLKHTDINWYTHEQDYTDFIKFDVIKATGIQE